MRSFNKNSKAEEQEGKRFESPKGYKDIKKKLYLIDYENVSDAGLVGIDKLTDHDCVVIFYGSKIKSIAYESLIAITSSEATIEHLKAEKTAKNYLDFQLTTYLGYKLGKEKFDGVFVISKDSGFDAVIDFWNAKGLNIQRQVAITTEVQAKPKRATTRTKVTTKPKAKKATPKSVSTKDKTRSELRVALKGCGLTAPEYKKVYDAFNKSTTTSSYNNNLQKAFGNDKTSEIYKATGKIFEKTKKV